MKAHNILLITFITLISSSIAGSGSATTSSSLPKSLHSGDNASTTSTKSVASSTTNSAKSGSTTSSSGESNSSSVTKLTSSVTRRSVTGMPTIATTASTISNSTSSSYTVTFTPIVPSASNPYIHYDTLPSGTTFTVVGAVLGAVFSVLILTRLIKACLSFRAAKKGTMSQNQQKEFDYDPSLFKEKDLMKHTSRASIYSLGSTSTTNVLGSQASMEQMIAPSGRSLRTALMNNNSRASMFISPTEMLANQQLYNHGFEDQGYFSYNSPLESPYGHTPTHSTFDKSPDTNRGEPKKKSRPPSVYLEQLFDDDGSIVSDQVYDSNAHNRV